ncbi:MAG: NADH-quinone oxidoreductase subunit NuoE [Ornithinimicrobium sp.]|uniref:NADH-quinone oxidoreductase subunit NuoE n=1 Tax=Ornithinimicrobium sp. TaxID=1977084 RepID=UPI0026DFAA08|nr:NADH-quinone oxidoreductase subunit NuoE [Ornithinimicrobium sp.]MDO5739616.1 NADH-quinone oxidoreductase subunit NuoE [Ornithinimicrobium sp.]
MSVEPERANATAIENHREARIGETVGSPSDAISTSAGISTQRTQESPFTFTQGQSPLHYKTPLHASDEPYADDVLAQLDKDCDEIIARYPQKRSALLPMLHLIQSVDGYVTGRGVHYCADKLDLATAEVSGVATFYTQYKRHPNGEYTVGVCTNTLCAIMGGDQIFDEVSEHLGIGHDETTEDGLVTLERIECNAACDFAPVVMVNWEFFDEQTPESTKEMVDQLRAGQDIAPTRGASKVCSFKQVSRVLAGFPDGRADEGIGAGEASLRGLQLAREKGWTAPAAPAAETGDKPSEESGT